MLARNIECFKVALLLLVICIGKSASADQTPTAVDDLYGFWRLENSPVGLRIALKHNSGFAKIFLLGGDWPEVSTQQESFPNRGKAAELTESFRINSSNVNIPFIGQKEVVVPNSDSSQTRFVEEIYYIPAKIGSDKLTLRLNDGNNLEFRKTNFGETIFEYAGLAVSSLAAIALLVFALTAYAKVGVSRVSKIVSAKRDRRYKDWGRLRGGGSYQSIAVSILIGFGIIFAVHNVMLGFLGISGVLSHIKFWLF